MHLELSTWTHHLNQLLYSYFYFCKEGKKEVKIRFNKEVKHNGAILNTTLEHTEKLYAEHGFISFTWSRKKMRSAAQQGAMELYFRMAAKELNNAGIYQEINSQFFKKPLSKFPISPV